MPRVYVGGIPSDCRDRDLDRFFRNYGRVRDVLIKNGYAFIVSRLCLILYELYLILYENFCVQKFSHVS